MCVEEFSIYVNDIVVSCVHECVWMLTAISFPMLRCVSVDFSNDTRLVASEHFRLVFEKSFENGSTICDADIHQWQHFGNSPSPITAVKIEDNKLFSKCFSNETIVNLKKENIYFLYCLFFLPLRLNRMLVLLYIAHALVSMNHLHFIFNFKNPNLF